MTPAVARPSGRRLVTFAVLLLLSALTVAMVEVRSARTGDHFYDFLTWNLFLAWVPFAVALVLYDAHRRGASTAAQVGLGAVWLLFLPNAPYVLTDYMHLTAPEADAAPFWFDLLLVTAAAWTGLALGLVSVLLVHTVLRRALGPAVAWAGVVAALGLATVGIFLGRFLRWNSWDVVAQPSALLADVRDLVVRAPDRPHEIAAALVVTVFLTLAYLLLYSVAGPPAAPQSGRAQR
jgi:uncharacterized membrane protein